MEFTARSIAELLGGSVVGDKDVAVNMVSKIEEGGPGTLTFLGNPIYEEYIYKTEASVCLVNNDFSPKTSVPDSLSLIKVENVYECFAKLLSFYQAQFLPEKKISKHAAIHETASIEDDVYIGDFVSIGANVSIAKGSYIYSNVSIGRDSTIGENAIIYSNVTIYYGSKIGKDVTLHGGVTIGADGFGFAPNAENNYNKVPQIGNVVLEDDVEVGANTCIDRATLGSTIIRKGVKLDNLIQVGHNVEIGEHTVIAGQTGIAGSTKIGKKCLIGGQVGIVGHLTIGDEVKIAAQSGIGKSLENGAIVQGSPAFPILEYKKSNIEFRNLPTISRKVAHLERLIEQLDRPNE
ncbi:MAG: UDP-3-O-(3-hydroxymyristoyl)glucosamine N-acyltransferase [Flavobacteriales bacterium]|nr:UDP-3-O-(3-hydroxymyristoyl)glucosamine N-acyltransferase [Flavobacteriales bacterium]